MFDESVRVTECFVASHYSRNRVSRRVARIAMNFRAIKIGRPEITLNSFNILVAVRFEIRSNRIETFLLFLSDIG